MLILHAVAIGRLGTPAVIGDSYNKGQSLMLQPQYAPFPPLQDTRIPDYAEMRVGNHLGFEKCVLAMAGGILCNRSKMPAEGCDFIRRQNTVVQMVK